MHIIVHAHCGDQAASESTCHASVQGVHADVQNALVSCMLHASQLAELSLIVIHCVLYPSKVSWMHAVCLSYCVIHAKLSETLRDVVPLSWLCTP